MVNQVQDDSDLKKFSILLFTNHVYNHKIYKWVGQNDGQWQGAVFTCMD